VLLRPYEGRSALASDEGPAAPSSDTRRGGEREAPGAGAGEGEAVGESRLARGAGATGEEPKKRLFLLVTLAGEELAAAAAAGRGAGVSDGEAALKMSLRERPPALPCCCIGCDGGVTPMACAVPASLAARKSDESGGVLGGDASAAAAEASYGDGGDGVDGREEDALLLLPVCRGQRPQPETGMRRGASHGAREADATAAPPSREPASMGRRRGRAGV
jgi:hypothetical protein